jgi:hypothetical protein
MKPWMQDDQIKFIERILISFNKNHVDVLEWGSGGSTVYFTHFLKNRKISYKWLSVEHHKGWHKKISKILKNDTDINFLIYPQNKQDPQSINFDMYVNSPRVKAKETGLSKFDFILIDGRARARCLIEAKFLLKPGGIILLHDGECDRYHYAFSHFESGKMIKSYNSESSIWITGDYEKLFINQ